MSEFSRYLTKLKDNRNLTSADLAEMCGMNRVIIWQWTEGKHLPESWDRMEPVIEKLRLTQEERTYLKNVYEYEILGKEKSEIFHKIKDMLLTLSEKRAEFFTGNKILYQNRGGTSVLLDFLKFDNRMDVLQCIQRVMEYMEGQEQPEMFIKLHTMPESLMMNLKSFCNKKTESNIELAICASETNGEYVQESLQLTKIMIDLMMQKSTVKCYSGQTLDELGQAEQNWIVSGDIFLQFSDDMSLGMFTKDQEWIRFFREKFQKIKENCSQICVGQCAALTYVYRNANHQSKIRVIEHMPCFSVALTEEILENGIHKEIPFRTELIQGILANFGGYASYLVDFVSMFEKHGVIEFMETGMVDVFPYGIYHPIPLSDRCEMLESMIHTAERTAAWKLLMIKEGIANLKGIHMEMRMQDVELDPVIVEIHFDEQENEQIELTDERVKTECWKFFDYLREFGYVYSKEETLEIMRGILEEYREKLGEKERR